MTKFPIKIKRFIRDGHLTESGDIKDTLELLDRACHLLDRAESHDICGEILFEGSNGKIYCLTVEAVIDEANPEYVKDVLAEKEEE